MSRIAGQDRCATSDAGGAPSAVRVRPGDPRYQALVRGHNQRWRSAPECVVLALCAADVVETVQEAVDDDKRISVRSGGHCYENFVHNSEIDIVLDLSEMNDVVFDGRINAFGVEPGAQLLDVYETLYRRWGVTMPGGMCYSVGVGGHICGGGYGFLSRKHGLVADHLYAVEVVVVDERGTAHTVIATRDADDPNHDLWWAHTGAGGGNFGIVTRYWLRSPDAEIEGSSSLLPQPPEQVLLSAVSWDWEAMTETAFATLVRNYCTWHENNSAPDSDYVGLFANLQLTHRSKGQIGMLTQMDATLPHAASLLDEFLATVNRGVGITPGPVTASIGEHLPRPQLVEPQRVPWLHGTQMVTTGTPSLTNPTLREKYKTAYLRSAFDAEQIATLYRYLSDVDYTNPDALVVVQSYGGQLNVVDADTTANPHRGSIMFLMMENVWQDEADDAYHIDWSRRFYRDLFAATGGVPVHDDTTEGCYVNFPDVDLGDPDWNTSGQDWSELYYGANAARLRDVKRRWDPRNVFRHAQSISR